MLVTQCRLNGSLSLRQRGSQESNGTCIILIVTKLRSFHPLHDIVNEPVNGI